MKSAWKQWQEIQEIMKKVEAMPDGIKKNAKLKLIKLALHLRRKAQEASE